MYRPVPSTVPAPAGLIDHDTAMLLLAASSTVAWNCWVCAGPRVAVAGEICVDAKGYRITLADPVCVSSAALVAVTVTTYCAEIGDGAV